MILDFVLSLDRSLAVALNGGDSMFLDQLMLILTSTTTWIPLFVGLLYLVFKNNESSLRIFIVVAFALLALLCSYYISSVLVKPSVARLRPCNDGALNDLIQIIQGYREHDFSFYSGHAANTMTIAVFMSLLVRNTRFSIMMLSWSFLNGYTRLYLAMHYFSDVVVGFISGALIGFMAYYLYKKLSKQLSHTPHYISSHYTASGYALADISFVLLLFSISLLYSIIKTALNVG